MKLALAQSRGALGDVAANLAAIRRIASEATDASARLVVFPEAFLTGYNLGEQTPALAEPQDGPSLAELRAIASEQSIAILCGYYERAGDEVFNSALLVDRDGTVLLNHRKTHLFGESEQAMLEPGDSLVGATLDGVEVGVLICYEIEFPEAARSLALAGAQLILVPTALMEPHAAVAETLIPARAAENEVFVAYANRVGTEGDLTYVGRSCLCGPDGGVLATADPTSETLMMVEVDLATVAAARVNHSYLRDRRPGLYGALASVR
jgi:predicted amidohydrolase